MTGPVKKASLATDWHKADIKAALAKVGWSLNQLGLAHGYTCKSALARALHAPYPRAERIIADAVGVKPEAIWPSRYNANGESNRPRGRAPMRPAAYVGKSSTAANAHIKHASVAT